MVSSNIRIQIQVKTLFLPFPTTLWASKKSQTGLLAVWAFWGLLAGWAFGVCCVSVT